MALPREAGETNKINSLANRLRKNGLICREADGGFIAQPPAASVRMTFRIGRTSPSDQSIFVWQGWNRARPSWSHIATGDCGLAERAHNK
jgi:hypothetical protein